jgi:hypothetical protein
MTTFKEIQKMRKLSTKADYVKICNDLGILIPSSMKKNEIKKKLEDIHDISNILTIDEKETLEKILEHNKKQKQKIFDAPQIYICPASYENMENSIIKKREIDGILCSCWAYNKKYTKKWVNMEIGSLCIFGCKKYGYTKAAYVIEKKNLNKEEKDWPFKGIDNEKDWSCGFILSEPFNISIEKENIQQNIRQKDWQSQILLDEKCADNIKKLLMS